MSNAKHIALGVAGGVIGAIGVIGAVMWLNNKIVGILFDAFEQAEDGSYLKFEVSEDECPGISLFGLLDSVAEDWANPDYDGQLDDDE